MNVVGIIVEYNPFHNGHKLHIEKAREMTGCPYVVAVMSGNFLQRGEVAIFDKWVRAEMAVKSGVDLVLELPAVFAIRSAQYFAQGAIRLLSALGLVTHLCFGAECSNIETLYTIAATSSNRKTITKMQQLMKSGVSYASALSKTIQKQIGIPSEMIASPNNILGIEYLKAIKKFAQEITPVAIAREHAGYHDTEINSHIASATAIRAEITTKRTVTAAAKGAMPYDSILIAEQCIKDGRGPVTLNVLEKLVLSKLRIMSNSDIDKLPDVSEGLNNKISAAALKATTLEEFMELTKSRRYPYTRLRRILIHALLGTNQTEIDNFDNTGPLYARVLAFNNKGRNLLKAMATTATIPTIIKTTDYLNSKRRASGILKPLERMLAIDTLASDIYVLGMPNAALSFGGWDFYFPPKYIPHS